MTLISGCNPKKDYLVTIKTTHGEIKLILFDDTPLHKENFLKLAKEGRYNGTIFHRVMKGFMIQGGDINTKEGTRPAPDNMVPAEFHNHYIHKRGALAAAHNGNPERKSSECQFYIVQGRSFSQDQLTLDAKKVNMYFGKLLSLPAYQELRQEIIELQKARDIEGLEAKMVEAKPLIEKEFQVSVEKEVTPAQLEAYTTIGGAPHLDGLHTVFGEVIEGMDVVDAIADQAVGANDKPNEDIEITVTVEELKKKKITKLYGYQYPPQ